MRYVVGLDGGGTRTRLCCLNMQGQVLSAAEFGTLSVSGNQEGLALDTLRNVVAYLKEQPGGLCGCAGITVAAAGVSNPRTAQAVAQGLLEGGYTGPHQVVGDHLAALQGAVGRVGAVLIAGTGSICVGRGAEGTLARAGGGGHLLDDGGSGYALGLHMLRAVYRAADGRAPRTALEQPVLTQLGLSAPQDIVGWLYAPGRSKADTAALAPLLTEAVAAEDKAAQAIAREAGRELCTLCVPVLEELHLQQGPLAFMGGVLGHIAPVIRSTQQALLMRFPTLRIVQPRADAAQGAAELALLAFPDS